MSEKQNKLRLSATLITLNEEKNIERVIKSLNFVDEILIYDSGSTDKTIEFAQKLGAKVIQGSWLGFGLTKKKVVELAANEWIFSIDADEEVSDNLARELQKNFQSFQADTIYSLPRLSFYLGKWIYHGGWYPDRQLRIFNRSNYQWNNLPIHEKVEKINGQSIKIENLKNNLNHFVFSNIDHQVLTNNKYSTLQARVMIQNGKTFSWFHFFTKPYVKFIECYLLKLGFLDGWPGYLIARNAAYSVFLKWAKLKEFKKERTL